MSKMMTEEEMRSAVSAASKYYEPGAGQKKTEGKKTGLVARMKKMLKRKPKNKETSRTKAVSKELGKSLSEEEISRLKSK